MGGTYQAGIQLQLEVTNICDAACVFCPYPSMKRPKGRMDMDLFRRLIDEAATLPLIDHITFTGLGETLLDKDLMERIRYTRSVMPHIMLDMYSNGSQLTDAKMDELIALRLSILYVSLNATRKEARQQIMYHHRPGYDDYDRVCAVLDYGIARYREKPVTKIMVKAIVSKDLMEVGEQEVFDARWNGRWDQGGNSFMHLEGNWAGAMYPVRVKPITPCSRALGQIMVLQDGRVSLCCFDSEGGEILGDLNVNTIREVFNGPKALGIRTAHSEGRRSEIPLCAGCTAI